MPPSRLEGLASKSGHTPGPHQNAQHVHSPNLQSARGCSTTEGFLGFFTLLTECTCEPGNGLISTGPELALALALVETRATFRAAWLCEGLLVNALPQRWSTKPEPCPWLPSRLFQRTALRGVLNLTRRISKAHPRPAVEANVSGS